MAAGGYTKSEPGAVATGSFPRCLTTPVITKSGLGKKETIVHAFDPVATAPGSDFV